MIIFLLFHIIKWYNQFFSIYSNLSKEFEISSSYSNHEYVPKDLLNTFCEQVFPQNTITLFYMNNHVGMTNYPAATGKCLSPSFSLYYSLSLFFSLSVSLSVSLFCPSVSLSLSVSRLSVCLSLSFSFSLSLSLSLYIYIYIYIYII